jgi:hypothetical protein
VDQDALAPFLSADDWTASRLESDPDAGDYRRRQGFGRAAVLLLETAAAQEIWNDRDPLLLPALYSFRHYVELELKELGRDAVAFGARPPKATHTLGQLWPAVRDGFARCFPGDDDAIPLVERAIAVLCALDPLSDGLRYATRRDGTPSIPQDVYLDPAALLGLVREVILVFEAAESAFRHQIDVEREMAEAFRGW